MPRAQSGLPLPALERGEGGAPWTFAAAAPHPTPLPVKNGEREQNERVAALIAISMERGLVARQTLGAEQIDRALGSRCVL